MPGLQLASFWEGNRSQLFATHVLSSVAAVVPVPVSMDFGTDLLCTLTHREGPVLYAGRSFAVQVKSESEPEVRYGGLNKKGEWKRYEIDWLWGQDQVFFLCVVDLREWTVKVYSTQRMWWVRWQKGIPGEVVLVPDARPEDFASGDANNRYPFERIPDTASGTPGDGFSYRVPLGPPIVCVEVKEQEAPEFRDRLRLCLDAWISLDYRNLTHRALRVPYVEEWTSWNTNELPGPAVQLVHFFNPNRDQNIPEILASISPAIASLMHNLNHQGQVEKLEEVKSLARMLDSYGVLDGTAVNFVRAPAP
jgi:hypothetical protein